MDEQRVKVPTVGGGWVYADFDFEAYRFPKCWTCEDAAEERAACRWSDEVEAANRRMLAKRDASEAMAIYHAAYDNTEYHNVTRRMSIDRANRLTDDALARCGYPGTKPSGIRWGKAACHYLARFQS